MTSLLLKHCLVIKNLFYRDDCQKCMKMKIKVIGAGLAGSEASYQLAKLGFDVELYEQKPIKFSPAHKSQNFAELVCSNSLKSNDLTNACGLLKEELRMLSGKSQLG